MRFTAIVCLLCAFGANVAAQQHRHHHGDLRLDDYHRRIQKRNSTPFDTPVAKDDTEASTSTGRSVDSPYTSLEGTRPYYEATPTTTETTDTTSVTTIDSQGSPSTTAIPTSTTGLSYPEDLIGSEGEPSAIPSTAVPSTTHSSLTGASAPSSTDLSGAPAALIGAPDAASTTTTTSTQSGLSPSTFSGLSTDPTPLLSPLPIDVPEDTTTTKSSGLSTPSVAPDKTSSSGSSKPKAGSPTLRPAFSTETPESPVPVRSDLSHASTTTATIVNVAIPQSTTSNIDAKTSRYPANSTAIATVPVADSGASASLSDAASSSSTIQPSTPTETGVSPAAGTSTSVTPTDTESPTMVLPETIITATPTTATPVTDGSASAADPQATNTDAANPVVNSLPAAIAPATGMVMPNSSQTMVQFGFYEPLNYPFVVSNALATAQILSYAPKCAAYALNLPNNAILDNSLRPYTMDGYTATVAYLVIPSNRLGDLEVLWANATSLLYNQEDSTLQSLAVLIDRSIPLLLTTSKGTTTKGNSGTSSSGNSASGSMANPASYGSLADTGTSTTSGSVVKIAGIGLGSAAAAGVYASIMFYAARRYRSRRITLFAPSAASFASSRGTNYDRGISISRPMNPENSLGI